MPKGSEDQHRQEHRLSQEERSSSLEFLRQRCCTDSVNSQLHKMNLVAGKDPVRDPQYKSVPVELSPADVVSSWSRTGNAVTAPRTSNDEYCPFPISPNRHTPARTPKAVNAMIAVQRSSEVRAESEPTPRRLSTGVRNMNSERLATVKSNNGQMRCSGAKPATSPVKRGTSSRPQAPCSRGTTMARLRAW